MKQNDLITVLMPAYNAARYIDKAVASVLSQTYQHFELLIMDDGSTDETRDILARYQDGRIRVVRRKNRGLGCTLREGIQLSNGRYIARMDADDESVPDRLALQRQFLQANENCGVVHSCADFIDENGAVVGRNVGVRADSISTKWQLIWKNALIHPTVMIRTDVLTRHDINYDAELKSSEDFDLWNQLALVTDIEIMPQSLLRYRTHKDSFTETNQKDFHFDFFVRVLTRNFERYGLELDTCLARELAVISEHTKIDPRTYRYSRLEQTLLRLYSEMNRLFREKHRLSENELDRIQGEQILTWSRYMLNTSHQRAKELLMEGFRKNTRIFARKFFWLVFANVYINRGPEAVR